VRPRIDLPQFRISLLLLVAVGSAWIAVLLVARMSPLMARHLDRERQQHRAMNGVYEFTNGYLDFGEYVLLDRVPRDDHSRGGVYFIGASDTMISIMPWELPPQEGSLIHNYAIADLSHREALYFLRNLIEEQNLLQAGAERVTVMLGLFYHMTREKRQGKVEDEYVPMLFRRHGLYTFDPDEGIRTVPMTRAGRFVRREHVYAKRFLRVALGSSLVLPAQDPDAAEYGRQWTRLMGPNWRQEMEAQMEELTKLLDFLRRRGVRVRVILPPHGSWHHHLPFPAAYREKLLPILECRNVPITDLSHLLPDADFGDSMHVRYSGQSKVHSRYRDLALQAIADMGISVSPEHVEKR